MVSLVSIVIWVQFALSGARVIDKRLLIEENYPQLINRLDALSDRVSANELKLQTSHQPVAFKVHLRQKLIPTHNQRIIFDDVQLNIGGAYHSHLGGFMAPVNGTYLFSVSVCSNAGHHITLELIRNSAMIGRVLAGDHDFSDCSSETTITELQAGDEVYIQQTTGDVINVHYSLLNSFTGALLHLVYYSC